MVKSSRTKSSHFKEKRTSPAGNRTTNQMCPIHGDFKQFHATKAKDFRFLRKVSSIMRAKLLSIM
jgi:hypothetical protein